MSTVRSRNAMKKYKGNKSTTLNAHPHYTKSELKDSLKKAGKTNLRYSGKEQRFYHD